MLTAELTSDTLGNTGIGEFNIVGNRDEKDHRSGPKTRTGPDSGPSPRPKKIENNNPEKTDRTRTGLNRTGPKNRRFSTIFICYF